MLKMPNFTLSFLIHVDASSVRLGAVLSQNSNSIELPIAYVSITLLEAERNYSTTEKEALGLVWSLKSFAHTF